MFIINVINSIPSPNTHMVNIIFATILIIVIILSVKRTTINGITTTRHGHFVVTISVLISVLVTIVIVAVIFVVVAVVVAVVVVVAVEISKREEFRETKTTSSTLAIRVF